MRTFLSVTTIRSAIVIVYNIHVDFDSISTLSFKTFEIEFFYVRALENFCTEHLALEHLARSHVLRTCAHVYLYIGAYTGFLS